MNGGTVAEPGTHTVREDPMKVLVDPDAKKALPWHFTVPPKKRYALRAIIETEDGGGFCAQVAELPGVVTQGSSVEEVLSRLTEAAAGAIECYLEAKEEIPWLQPDEVERATNIADNCVAISVETDG